MSKRTRVQSPQSCTKEEKDKNKKKIQKGNFLNPTHNATNMAAMNFGQYTLYTCKNEKKKKHKNNSNEKKTKKNEDSTARKYLQRNIHGFAQFC